MRNRTAVSPAEGLKGRDRTMTKLVLSLATAVAVAGGFAVLPAPAMAQQANGEVVVFGDDPCPRSTDSQVYVCTRRPEADRRSMHEDRRGEPR